MASNRDGRALYLDLSKGRVNSPIYLIYGEETFLVDETIKMMVRAVLPNGVDNFSHEIFDGAETPGLAIRQALENLPLFGGQRLIMVRNIASIPVDETAALMPYFERPAPETTFLMTGRTVDFRKRFFKAVRKSKNCWRPWQAISIRIGKLQLCTQLKMKEKTRFYRFRVDFQEEIKKNYFLITLF